MRKKQPEFNLGPYHETRKEHGGSLRQGRRKLARPLDPKRAIHLVLRADCARGALSMLRPGTQVRLKKLEARTAHRWKVRIYRSANAGNHLHLLVKAPTREAFQGFLREFSGLAARLVTGARKGKPFGKRFWDSLAYSRVVEWGRAFMEARHYVIRNELEAEGLLISPRQSARRVPSRPRGESRPSGSRRAR